jgi:hypothetical protein
MVAQDYQIAKWKRDRIEKRGREYANYMHRIGNQILKFCYSV